MYREFVIGVIIIIRNSWIHMFSQTAGWQVRLLESSWNVMAHGDTREGKWRGNWRMECVAGILHTTSELSVSSITTADAHTSAVSSRLNWRPRRFKWIRPFRRKTKSGFCACAITFQTQSTRLTEGWVCPTRGLVAVAPPLFPNRTYRYASLIDGDTFWEMRR